MFSLFWVWGGNEEISPRWGGVLCRYCVHNRRYIYHLALYTSVCGYSCACETSQVKYLINLVPHTWLHVLSTLSWAVRILISLSVGSKINVLVSTCYIICLHLSHIMRTVCVCGKRKGVLYCKGFSVVHSWLWLINIAWLSKYLQITWITIIRLFTTMRNVVLGNITLHKLN